MNHAKPQWVAAIAEAMTRATDQKLTAVSVDPNALMQLWQAYSDTRAALVELVENAVVQAVILKVNTPTAASLPELTAAIDAARKAISSNPKG